MNIWLDDNRPAPPGWLHAKTAADAAATLMSGPVDEMSLDCDLDMPDCSTCQFECGHRDQACRHACQCHKAGITSGVDLVKWMASNGVWPRKKPRVHSANAMGAAEMQAIIDAQFPGER